MRRGACRIELDLPLDLALAVLCESMKCMCVRNSGNSDREGVRALILD